MDQLAFDQITALCNDEKARERTITYLAEHLEKYVKKRERVLICFPEHREGNLSWLYERAVLRCEGVPVLWGPDHRWKTLLQQAFYSHASTIIGPPLIILGLSKLKKHNGIPLYIRHVVTAGYPCPDWMIDGMTSGLDCSTYGSFGIGTSGVVAGFSCRHIRGIHLRDSEYGVDIIGPDGESLPMGEEGEIVLYPKARPELRYPMGESGHIETGLCLCGCRAPKLVGIHSCKMEDPALVQLGQELQSWTSVLDCRLQKGMYGLELELVVFAGEKLPKLPTVAKQVIRPWDPKHDEPFPYEPCVKKTDFSSESY